jgi:surfeit locus 1 family protein
MTDVSAAQLRPVSLLWPTLLTVVGVAVLCVLGGWQLLRMEEKRVFIERLQSQALSAPSAMPPSANWGALDPLKLDLQHVKASGTYIDGASATVRTTIAAGAPGTRQLSGFGRWMFQGFQLDDGGVLLVNRGFVPESRINAVVPATGRAEITGYLRAPEGRNSFTPADIAAKRDPAAIAAAVGIKPAPFYFEAAQTGDGLTPPAGLNVRELIGRIPDNHLQYAVTWFGLALTLLGVFAAFAWSARRERVG